MPLTDRITHRSGHITWGIFFVFLFLYRSFFSVLAELVVMRITQIGDTRSYQSGVLDENYAPIWNDVSGVLLSGQGWSQLSTALTTKVGFLFHSVLFGNAILIDIGFQTITFIGLVYLLLSVEPRVRSRLAILVMFPSFTVWTSIASKEAIVAFAVCILSGYLIRMYYNEGRLGIHHIFAAAILLLFKMHYLGAFAYAIIMTKLCWHTRQKALLALISGLVSLLGLYLIRDWVDEMAFSVQQAFQAVHLSRSTRLESFFVDQYDVFLKAPLGMFRAFMGPQLGEIMSTPLHLFSFVESVFLLALLTYFMVRRLPTLPIYNTIIGAFTVFWIVFPNYAFGVMNSGSAVRYRSGWIVLLFVIFAFLMSREVYVTWRGGSGRQHVGSSGQRAQMPITGTASSTKTSL